jgi:hypothetical protein
VEFDENLDLCWGIFVCEHFGYLCVCVCDCPQVPDGFIIGDHREMSNARGAKVSECERVNRKGI